jgi:ribosomal protein S4
MLNLELGLKKKTLAKFSHTPLKKKSVYKKGFMRLKKNRAYRLFSSRAFNLWRTQFRFTVRLRALKIKFQLIGKLLLRHFKMNKHFFKKRSTLSYIEKLQKRNYTVTCRKNMRFFYIIERRLLVVLARLYITRIVLQDQLKFLIVNGYVSVDNEVIKTPYHLVQHKSIIRVLKSIPRTLSRVPKILLRRNLRWSFYKRAIRRRRFLRANRPFRQRTKRRDWH